nr:UDP-N-acetylmuramate dehydrogenase [Nocardioides daedukensis]
MLRDVTTLRLGGPAARYVEADNESALIEAVSVADAAGESVLLVAGGSNLVVGDSGFAGTVVRIATRGIGVEPHSDHVLVTAAAGESWDDFVNHCVESGWVGVEALSGIPGAVGSTPIQNVGAYGQEVAATIDSVRVWDRELKGERVFTAAECSFGYRHSRFKADPARHLVLDVTFRLQRGREGEPVAYAELARALGIEQGQRAPLEAVRREVLALRRGKGMVLDAADHDTWSAGSFFTNPFLDDAQAAGLPAEAPRWPQPDGRVKTSAAWLIEHAGFSKGHGNDRVSLSTKHTLALTNRGQASTADLLALALEVRDGVEMAFGVRLVNEPVLVGCAL